MLDFEQLLVLLNAILSILKQHYPSFPSDIMHLCSRWAISTMIQNIFLVIALG